MNSDCWGGRVDNELQERVMLERVELIARLTSEGMCRERDREIALNLIAEIASNTAMANKQFSVVFSAVPLEK
ncbi:hypothetical protein PZBJ_13880 [Pantoea endophytica]|uniref:Tum protein n=1 Tax=Pantoea endophytica TaxID=92488 RepID=A0ABX4SPW1_9GAMM|nr:hypothetical protein PZBJ_13880 [Pantoea endophytica]